MCSRKYLRDFQFQKSFSTPRPLTLELLASQGAILLKNIEYMLLIHLHHSGEAYRKSLWEIFTRARLYAMLVTIASQYFPANLLHRKRTAGVFRWRSPIQFSWTIYFFPVFFPVQFTLTPKKVFNPIFHACICSIISLCYTIHFNVFKLDEKSENRKCWYCWKNGS